MARSFLFAASILLCLALGQSLECKECLFDIPGKGCITGTGRCTTEPGDPCLAITIRHKGSKAYRVYGCSTPDTYRCGVSKVFYGQSVKIKCCHSSNLCNKRF